MEIKPKKIVIVEPLVQQEDPPETVIPQALQLNIEEILLEEDPIPELVELNNSIKNCIKPESECVVDITNNWPELEVSEDVKKLLNNLFIRFNTSPKLYNKIDYLKLLQLIYGGLIHLYKNNPENLIVTNWLNPLSDVQVPSEKLTKETIDSLDNEITQVSSDLQTEIGNRQSEISRVEELISAEESARILSDQQLQNTKQDNLIEGDNISIINNTISAVDTIYDDTEVRKDISDLLQNKLDNLTAGNNISINGTTISAVDTTYTASDFDIKDLSDSTNLRQAWSGKQDELTAGENIQINGTIISATDTIYDDTEVRGLIDAVDLKVDNLDNFECGTIVPTTTNFVEGTEYTVHEALQRTANLFEGYQGYIDDINELIPNQATTQNQLADKAFVNSTVATNAANFRGNWSNWTSVPENANLYPEDYVGNRTPTNNDYIVVQDASDYVNTEGLIHKLTVVNLHATKAYTIGVTDEYGVYNEYYYASGFNRTWKTISTEYSLKYEPGSPGLWYIKTNKPEDTDIIKDSIMYSNANDGIFLVNTNDSTIPVIIGIPSQTGQYQGSWRFIYVGDWDTLGKSGWKPQYQIGTAFTAAQQAAIDSGVTSAKVSTYDGYSNRIGAVETDKLDKVYTANKIYGTNNLGILTAYIAGGGISFNNGLINSTAFDDLFPLIAAGL